MDYMLMSVNDFFGLVESVNTSDKVFIKKMCDTSNENPTEDVALQFNKPLYISIEENSKYNYSGGIATFNEKIVGLARALIGVQNNYNDIGTCMLSNAYIKGKKLTFTNGNSNAAVDSITIAENVIATKTAYENTEYALTKLYDSYIDTKTNHRDIYKTDDAKKMFNKCDSWYIMSAILNNHSKLLDRIFKDGALAYPMPNRFEYLELAMVCGNIEVFNTLLKYETYTDFTDDFIALNIVESRRLPFIIWYRKMYKKKTGHDIPFWRLVFHIKSIVGILKYLVTFPWIK